MWQYCNFGMANLEGYCKVFCFMKLAECFGYLVVCLIDILGVFFGLEVEECGQVEVIVCNFFEMVQLKVFVVCVVIGEGVLGGVIGIGLGDWVYMLENIWYFVIFLEFCFFILWCSWDYKE